MNKIEILIKRKPKKKPRINSGAGNYNNCKEEFTGEIQRQI